jgi:hypothetical protein
MSTVEKPALDADIAHVLTLDEARHIAKLPGLTGKARR